MQTWVEKYRPRTLKEVAGNTSAVSEVARWAEEWKHRLPEKRALLLYGPPGSGKTSTAYALAADLGCECIELNASDWRTKDVIERIVGTASSTGSLKPGQRKLIIIDEVDGIHGRAEYGGLAALKKLITTTTHPIVLIANNPWKLPAEFRKLTKMVEFRRINQRTVLKVLKKICHAEGIEADEKVLRIIASASSGDLRSAINDLQALAEGRKKLEIKDTEVVSIRDTEVKIFETIQRVLKTENIDRAIDAVSSSDEEPSTILSWLAENLPLEYRDAADLARAYAYLSRADVFYGRILRRQDWGLLRYVVELMSAGVALAKKQKYRGYTKYRYPEVFVLLAGRKGEKQKLRPLVEKLKESGKLHASAREIEQEYIPLLMHLASNPAYLGAVIREFGLERSHVELLTGSREKAEKAYRSALKASTPRSSKKERGRQVSLGEF